MPQSEAERDEQRILKARGKFKAQLLRWVADPDCEITQEVDKSIDQIMMDRRRRSEVFLTALSRKYVERAVFFIGSLPSVEKELLNPERITTMKNSDLIRLLCVMADQVGGAAEFLRNFVTDDDLRREPLPSSGAEFGAGEKLVTIDEVSDDERKAAAELSVESRQRIGGVLMKVIKAIDTVDKDKSMSVLVAPSESGGAGTEKGGEKSKGGT